jgi:DNA-binding NtrC family response regulator
VEEGLPFKEAKQRVIDEFEAAYLRALFDRHGDNVTRSAQAAGLTRYHLRELAKRYGIRNSEGD